MYGSFVCVGCAYFDRWYVGLVGSQSIFRIDVHTSPKAQARDPLLALRACVSRRNTNLEFGLDRTGRQKKPLII